MFARGDTEIGISRGHSQPGVEAPSMAHIIGERIDNPTCFLVKGPHVLIKFAQHK